LAKIKLSKKFTKMPFLAIFQTGKIRVLKMAKNGIFVNFLPARGGTSRAEFAPVTSL
jgi:hypothetical protein